MIHLLIPVLASLAAPQPAQGSPSAEELASWRAAERQWSAGWREAWTLKRTKLPWLLVGAH